jgi:hypothetical protein
MTLQAGKRNADGIAGFVDDLNGAVRENPVAAGLVGMGVLWMFFGSARISAFGSTLPNVARTVTNAVGAGAEATGSAVGDAAGATVRRVAESARQVGDAISSNAGNAATTVLDKASAAYDTLKASGKEATETVARTAKQAEGSSTQFGRDVGTSLQQNLTKTLEAEPLLLGVMGLAIGAGIASAFPSTKLERDVMGEAGAAVKDRMQEIASETFERAKEVFVEVKKEAAAQGLTPASARESLKSVGEKVKTAAALSQESLRDRLS